MQNRNILSRSARLERLEDRCVLSISLPQGVNLVVNGDFEVASGQNEDGYFSQESIVGWDSQEGSLVRLYDFKGDPQRGKVWQVDTSTSEDVISQDIQTIQGQKYLLSFDFRSGPDQGATNEIAVQWNGESLGVFEAIDHWQRLSFVVDGIQSGSSTLSFSEGAGASDTSGAFIDRVRLVPVEEIESTNASFENTNAQDQRFFKSKDVSGWNSLGDRRAKIMNIREEGGSQGNRFLNVDGSSEVVDGVFQNIGTSNHEDYFVSFDLKSATGKPDPDNDLRVRWNNEFMGRYLGNDHWQNFGFFAETDSDLTRLVFREVGKGDGRGPYIDNVKIFRMLPGTHSLALDIANNDPRTFIEGSGPTSLFNEDLSVANSVLGELTGAVVQIENLLDQGEEALAVNAGSTGITVEFNQQEGRLRLSGRASLEEYEEVLNSLTYENKSIHPDSTQRSLRISIDYKRSFSPSVAVAVNITPVNNAPEMNPIDDQSVTALTPFSLNVDATDEDGSLLTYSIASSGTGLGFGDTAPEISQDGQVTWTPNQSGELNIRVRATDSEGLYAEQEFTLHAHNDADLPQDFQPFSGVRQLSNVSPIQRNGVYSTAPDFNIDLSSQYTAVFQTDDGQIFVELYDDQTPETVNSFVNMARDGYYDGLTFHRVISLIGSQTEGFIYQGGDPLGTGTGGPGYNIDDELDPEINFVKPVIAMANRGAGTSTNGSQFFFTQDDRVQHLNQNHTIFGEISNGFDVVEKITKRSPGSSVAAEIIRKVTIVETL